MKFKQLHFHENANILHRYEVACAGCLTVHIWQKCDNRRYLHAFEVTLENGADQLDSADVLISEFENIEDAQEHARCVAQEMFEKYVRKSFLEG